MHRRLLMSLSLCVLLVLTTAAPAAPAAPDKLTLNDLTNHPERWPASVKLTVELMTGPREKFAVGTVCRVQAVQGQRVELILPDNSGIAARADQCDLVEAANAAWAKLTPEQRSLTVQTIMADMSLWPASVTVLELQDFGRFKIQPKQTVPLLSLQPNNDLALLAKGQPQWAPVPISHTDLFTRSRELAALPADKRPGRMAQVLDGLLVDGDGKPAPAKPVEYYVVYWSGSQCGWCQQYNPKFVEYYNKNLAGRGDVQVFSVPNDRQLAPFQAYSKAAKMTWPTLAPENRTAIEAIGDLGGFTMPGIVVFDKHGKVLSSTMKNAQGNPLQRGDQLLGQMDKLLVAKAP